MMVNVPLINADAERVLLGKILACGDLYYNIADYIKSADFGDHRHRMIFGAMAALVSRGTPIMRASMQSQLASAEMSDIDTASYLAALVAEATSGDYIHQPIDHFARIVVHGAARRQLIDVAREIKDRAASATLETPIEELRGGVISLVSSMDDVDKDGGGINFLDLMTKVCQRVSEKEKAGIRTGLWAFDRLVGPMLPGQLVVIGGETSSGKTALVLQLAYQVGLQQIPVEIFELEMTAEEVGTRWGSIISGIPVDKIAEGDVDSSDVDRMFAAGAKIGKLPIEVDDRPAASVSMIQARLARSIRHRGTKLAVVDHLQYCRPNPGIHRENEQIRQVVDDLKATAKRLNIPIILVSHVHRKSEWQPIEVADDIKRPGLGDLYGSSAIEKAADVVVFVHRPKWFLERASPRGDHKSQHAADLVRWDGRAEFVLCKNRQRKGFGVSECEFNEELTAFDIHSI